MFFRCRHKKGAPGSILQAVIEERLLSLWQGRSGNEALSQTLHEEKREKQRAITLDAL